MTFDPLGPHDPVWATLRVNWPAAAHDLAAEALIVDLTPAEIMALASHDPAMRQPLGPPVPWKPSKATLAEVDTALSMFGGSLFCKIGPFSLKSADRPAQRTRVTAGTDLGLLLRPPPLRIARAAAAALRMGRGLTLELIAWREIAEWSEFRVFFRDGTLVGISQANPFRAYPEIGQCVGDLARIISDFARSLGAVLPIPTCAADVAIAHPGFQAWLVEFNPFDHRLDLGLFAGAGPDGTFRFVQ